MIDESHSDLFFVEFIILCEIYNKVTHNYFMGRTDKISYSNLSHQRKLQFLTFFSLMFIFLRPDNVKRPMMRVFPFFHVGMVLLLNSIDNSHPLLAYSRVKDIETVKTFLFLICNFLAFFEIFRLADNILHIGIADLFVFLLTVVIDNCHEV